MASRLLELESKNYKSKPMTIEKFMKKRKEQFSDKQDIFDRLKFDRIKVSRNVFDRMGKAKHILAETMDITPVSSSKPIGKLKMKKTIGHLSPR